jgi:hypothetical protein
MATSPSIEFVVEGIPISANASGYSRRKWSERIRTAAAAYWPGSPMPERELSAAVVYFYRDGSIDVDNLIKPILDGLIGTIVDDDAVFAQVTVRKTELRSGLGIVDAPASLLEKLDSGSDFVFIRISPAPNHSVLP